MGKVLDTEIDTTLGRYRLFYFFFPFAAAAVAALVLFAADPPAVACFPNISAKLFIPFVFTFFKASTPRLPFASSLRFLAAAAALPPPSVERSDSDFEEPRPGR